MAKKIMTRKKFTSDKMFTFQKFKDVLKTIGRGVKKNPVIFSMLVFINIIDSILYSATIITVKGIVNALLLDAETADFLWLSLDWVGWAWASGIVIFLMTITGFFTNFLSMLFSKKVEINLRLYALNHLVDLDISYYSKNQLGLIMSRVVNDSQWFSDAFNEFFANFVYIIITSIVTIMIIFGIDVLIGYISLAAMITLLTVIWTVFVFFRRALLIAVDTRQEIDADIIDRLINIRLIKASGTENHETDRNKVLHNKYDSKQQRVIRFQSFLLLFNNITAFAFPSFMLIITIFLYRTTLEPAALSALSISVLAAATNLIPNLLLLTHALRGMARMANCVMRLNLIYNAKSLIELPVDEKELASIDTINFKNVSFSYPESPQNKILPTINLQLEKGKSYAFVGETGVGKSTIAKLLLRFYDASEGEVLINDINIKQLNLTQYLLMVGYVEQEPQILFGTIKENLTYGIKNYTEDEIIVAAKKAKLHNFVLGLSEGYDTILGERGFILSGGQKQRLIIAKLFLKNPQLLILDEATSALDNIVEKEIQNELNLLMKNRTTVVIAHRLSTIKNVDQIIVLDKLKGISQTGTFDELKNRPGVFKKLYEYGLLT